MDFGSDGMRERVLATSGTTEVLIGKGARSSGYMLESAMEAGLSAAGINVALVRVLSAAPRDCLFNLDL